MVRRWWPVLVAGVVAVVAVAAWLVWPSAPPSRARVYLSFTACLLTGAEGVAGAGAPAWAGLQDASLATRAKVQFVAVVGEATVANASPYLASLVQRQCRVVVAVGAAQVGAVAAAAPQWPRVRFVVVVGDGGSRGNVTRVDGSADQVRARVAGLVESAVAADGH